MNTQEPIPVWNAEIAVGKPPEDIDLLSYLPPFMAAYRELSAGLRAEEPEFWLLWQGAHRVLVNQFVLTADDFGLKRYETLLHLLPAPGDSIETRRARILAALMRHPPYTITWLRAWLDGLLGADGHSESVEDYSFSLTLDGDALIAAHLTGQDIIYLLYPILPVNLYWCIITTLEMQSALYFGSAVGVQAQLGIHEKPDDPHYQDTLHAGGRVGAEGTLALREQPDKPDFRRALHAGGNFGATHGLPIPQNQNERAAATILRTGGVTTILSNISKGD